VRIKLDRQLEERAIEAARKAGYSSVEEFVRHAIEKHLAALEEAQDRAEAVKQLKGLGYLE